MELHEMTTFIAAQVRSLDVVRSTVSVPSGKIRIKTEDGEFFVLQIEKELVSSPRPAGEDSSGDATEQSPLCVHAWNGS